MLTIESAKAINADFQQQQSDMLDTFTSQYNAAAVQDRRVILNQYRDKASALLDAHWAAIVAGSGNDLISPVDLQMSVPEDVAVYSARMDFANTRDRLDSLAAQQDLGATIDFQKKLTVASAVGSEYETIAAKVKDALPKDPSKVIEKLNTTLIVVASVIGALFGIGLFLRARGK